MNWKIQSFTPRTSIFHLDFTTFYQQCFHFLTVLKASLQNLLNVTFYNNMKRLNKSWRTCTKRYFVISKVYHFWVWCACFRRGPSERFFNEIIDLFDSTWNILDFHSNILSTIYLGIPKERTHKLHICTSFVLENRAERESPSAEIRPTFICIAKSLLKHFKCFQTAMI